MNRKTEKCEKENTKIKQNKIEPSMSCSWLKRLFGLDCVRSSNVFTPY